MIMKHLKLTLILVCLASMAFAQKNYGGVKKGSALGFSANLVDFTAEVPKVGPVSPGFSLMYWQGLTRNLDFSVRYNGLFSDYSKDPVDEGSYINELEASVHLRFQGNDHLFIPFLTAGIGAGNYGKSNIAPYVPLGLGLQLNMANEGYIFLQANYRVSLSTDNLDNNMFYSLGFAQNIRSTEGYVPPPPPPMPAPVLDTDKDGILDDVDKCPAVPGVAKYNGCPIPDTDGDGINDEEDKCVTVPGVAKYQGCPIPDTDGDGINDEEDKCVTVPGVAKYQGCPIPDTDGDGLNDEVDKCPNVAGPADNYGCPVIGIKSYEITFVSGKATLLAHGKSVLDTVVAYLNLHKGVNVTVDGYTDNTGTYKINDPLSVKRAEAAKAYIVSKGIDADRMTVAGFGSKDPIATNKTAAGRKQNRRIEIKIKE
jgi:outer membrane protein OmpA-like peptidoglycan-associated protein